MPPDIPPLTRAELAALRAPDLTAPIAMTIAQARALFHIGDAEAVRLEHGLRYCLEMALPDAGFEIVRELRKDE